MKKMFKYASLGAIALVGAVSFSACSSSDEVVDNPDYNPVEGTVKTQFAIGITSQANAKTRMSEATTQAQEPPAFRGMQDIVLIPFDNEPGDAVNRIGRYIQPGDGKIKGSEISTAGGSLSGTANYVVYNDVEIPVGTKYFLFYGHAPANTFEKGQLTTTTAYPVGTTTLDAASGAFVNPQTSLKFVPTSILAGQDGEEAGNNAKGKALIGLLNAVAGAKADVTSGTTTTTDKTWASVTASENELLNQLYTNFKAMTSGSSFNVHRVLQDLYYSVNNLAGTTDNPYNTIAKAIQTAILSDGTNSVSTNVLTFGDSYTGYPETELKIPEGAAIIKWDNTSMKFVDAIMNNTTGTDNIGAATPTVYSTYAYPADLWYWKKTAIHASNQIESTNFGNKSWRGEGGIIETDYKDDPTVVSGSTKSVALDDQINYAVGRLDLSINKLETSGIFLDSKLNKMDFGKTYKADATPSDDENARNGFKNAITLTGVLVGNQRDVDWQFLPVGTSTKEYVIYDKTMNNSIVALSTEASSGTNHTLVLETAANADVNIALQFVNNGGDFYGKNGQLIPSGGTFYLAGTLKVSDATPGSSLSQIFKQDYITKVDLTIKSGSSDDNNSDGIVDDGKGEGFQEATNTIPDLRTTLMELCFSVDLTWQQGLQFDVEW